VQVGDPLPLDERVGAECVVARRKRGELDRRAEFRQEGRDAALRLVDVGNDPEVGLAALAMPRR
jgi:hypothetical protein